MPLPLLLIGAAVAAGALGVGAGIKSKAGFDEAEDINERATNVYDDATASLAKRREAVQAQLEALGRQKLSLYQDTLTPFVEVFERIKHVDFSDAPLLDDNLEDIESDILDIGKITVHMAEAVGGSAGALGAGALAGLATYGSVGLLGTASTGTAIGGLSGVAATNATLAWLGGGSLATGGFGMAGGTAVLGGIVAAPVLLMGGLLLAARATAAKENARSNMAKAKAAAKAMQNAEIAARGIGAMADQTGNLLQELCHHLDRDVVGLQRIVRQNDDYRTYNAKDKTVVKRAVAVAVTLKNIAEARLLKEDGAVAAEIRNTVWMAKQFLKQLEAK